MMWRRPFSISLRLTMWFGAILLGGWLLCGAAMWFELKHALTLERQTTLDRRADRLEDLLARDAHAGDSIRYNDFHDFAGATGNGLVEIFRPSGERYWPSPSASAETFPWPAWDAKQSEHFSTVDAKGQPYLVMMRPYRLDATPVVIAAAAPEAGNVALLNRFWNSLLASAPALLLVAMAGGYWISRRALRPVDAITAAARSIGIRNLSERLPVLPASDELERLAATWNGMLDRLEIAVRKLRQFTADASHELRGPLTLTRTIAEVALANPHMDADSRVAFREIAEEGERSAALLDQMLELARADAEPVDMVLEPVDLSLIAEDAVAAARTVAGSRALSLEGTAVPAFVLGHPPSLRRLLWILLDNAMKYSPSDGRILTRIERQDRAVLIHVRDNGIGIAAENVPHIFDRFYRADPSRSEVEGSGLGLAIAKWITDVHHACIEVSSAEAVGTEFTVRFSI